jgi:hypothetical protein
LESVASSKKANAIDLTASEGLFASKNDEKPYRRTLATKIQKVSSAGTNVKSTATVKCLLSAERNLTKIEKEPRTSNLAQALSVPEFWIQASQGLGEAVSLPPWYLTRDVETTYFKHTSKVFST